MSDMPEINTLVHVVVHELAHFRSRIEDIDGTLLTIAAPLEAVDLELPPDGFDLEVFWNQSHARYVLPVRMTSRSRGQVARWHLEATGAPTRDNRRRFVRGGGGGSITLSFVDEEGTVHSARGFIMDVCEGGVRCRITRAPQIRTDDTVNLQFSVENTLLEITGTVLSLRPQDGKERPQDDKDLLDVIVGYELEERQAQSIRRHVMQWQMTERRRLAAERDRKLAS